MFCRATRIWRSLAATIAVFGYRQGLSHPTRREDQECFNLIITYSLTGDFVYLDGETGVLGIIHFSEELAQNPLKTVHCLSFHKARFEVQLLSNQSRQK